MVAYGPPLRIPTLWVGIPAAKLQTSVVMSHVPEVLDFDPLTGSGGCATVPNARIGPGPQLTIGQAMDFNDLVGSGKLADGDRVPLKKDLDDLGIGWDDLARHVGTALRGRPATEITVGTPRPLTEEEVVLGAELRSQQKVPTSAPPEILKLRSRHHLIAQLLSAGLKPSEVALKTGYSISRISVLQADPAFKELLSNYKGLQENIEFDVRERLRLISLDAIDVIQHRLDEKPEELDTKELMTLAELALDRTGHGKSATVQHQVGLDPETAALIRAQRPAARTANLLEGERLHERPRSNERSEQLESRNQLDLFDSVEQRTAALVEDLGGGLNLGPQSQGKATGNAYESAAPPTEAELHPGGEVEPDPGFGHQVSAAVYVTGESQTTVVQFRTARPGSRSSEPVD